MIVCLFGNLLCLYLHHQTAIGLFVKLQIMKTLNQHLISRQANHIKAIVKVDSDGKVFVTYKHLKTGKMIYSMEENITYLKSTIDFLIEWGVKVGIHFYNKNGFNYKLWSY